MSKNPIVRAVDAGYGVCKLIESVDADGTLHCTHFPCMAVPSDPATMRSLSIRQRDTVDVEVRGAYYEVGPDVLLAQTGNDVGREIGENWCLSDMYQAIMLGAMHYMKLPADTLDLLVLGLPVNQYLSEERCQLLASSYTKTHKLPGGREVTVKEVLVRPQPFGGYIDMGNQLDAINAEIRATIQRNQGKKLAVKPIKSAEQIVNEMCILVVDPGEHTLDWLMVDRGTINTKASSAASDSGRHRIVREVQRAIEQQIGRAVAPANLYRINECLRTGEPLKMSGEMIDLKQFDAVVMQAVADPISRLIEGLRGLEDRIDLIYLVGGHPEIYKRELENRFPLTPVVAAKDSIYSNVRGFQHMGEAIVASRI